MRERHSSDDRTYIRDRFIEYGVQIDARQLELGDVMWIAKRGNDELVLDCIVERKRADDLPHRLSLMPTKLWRRIDGVWLQTQPAVTGRG
jgi:ERCC4-type nuclease